MPDQWVSDYRDKVAELKDNNDRIDNLHDKHNDENAKGGEGK